VSRGSPADKDPSSVKYIIFHTHRGVNGKRRKQRRNRIIERTKGGRGGEPVNRGDGGVAYVDGSKRSPKFLLHPA
jgi:hypothetical protein